MATINWSLSIVSDKAAVLFATNPILQNEQVGREIDTHLFKIGDGVARWNDLAYTTINSQQSVWIGVSADAGNLLKRMPNDGGLAVPSATFASAQTVIDALGNSSAVGLFDTTDPVKAPEHRLAVLMRFMADSLGGDFSKIKTSQAPALNPTVMQRIELLEEAGIDITSILKDTVTATTSTWSSTKIANAISQAIADLVGSAAPALDTIWELADAVAENQNLITTISTDLSNTVRWNAAQNLTDPQKTQARANIDAASSTYLGTLNASSGNSFIDAFNAGFASTTDPVQFPAFC